MTLTHPHPEPREYPQMLRTWDTETWRRFMPLVGLLGLVVGMLFAVPLLLMPVLAIAVAIEGHADFSKAFSDAATLATVTPASMLYLNLALAGLVPLTWLLMRTLHRMRPRWLSSVKPGFRWKFFFACFGLSLVALAAQLVLGAFLPGTEDDIGGHLNAVTPTLVALAIVILLTTPLQAMGEEYAFRGYAMQAIGSFSGWLMEETGLRPRLARGLANGTAIVLTSAVFAVAHGVQNAPLFLDRFAFGLMAGYVVLRTGGLEAGIALHIWNNLLAFGIALTFTDIDSTLKVSEISWWNLPLTITQNLVYLVLVLWVARRMGLDNRTSPPVLAEQTAPV